MSKLKGLALALVISLAACVPITPDSSSDRSASSNQQGVSATGTMVGAPGPEAGIGLPILAIAGGFIWIKLRKRRSNRRQR
ncbi:hypothetical protein PSQ19_05080 [Devosia algicola]|uniref:PEP-CTERM sorting domain-containing protein n=1 Tax=Devosia algicola TaxID=3026418 RepID=A0ABY7YQZ6_9HYPH|nr:hypothetical protein [Devosia algicola]WDR03475.1 hypothetical protein PSQ19_05080 [Devosia algicola]